jgi:hypothetical protein
LNKSRKIKKYDERINNLITHVYIKLPVIENMKILVKISIWARAKEKQVRTLELMIERLCVSLTEKKKDSF